MSQIDNEAGKCQYTHVCKCGHIAPWFIDYNGAKMRNGEPFQNAWKCKCCLEIIDGVFGCYSACAGPPVSIRVRDQMTRDGL